MREKRETWINERVFVWHDGERKKDVITIVERKHGVFKFITKRVVEVRWEWMACTLTYTLSHMRKERLSKCWYRYAASGSASAFAPWPKES